MQNRVQYCTRIKVRVLFEYVRKKISYMKIHDAKK